MVLITTDCRLIISVWFYDMKQTYSDDSYQSLSTSTANMKAIGDVNWIHELHREKSTSVRKPHIMRSGSISSLNSSPAWNLFLLCQPLLRLVAPLQMHLPLFYSASQRMAPAASDRKSLLPCFALVRLSDKMELHGKGTRLRQNVET